VGVRRDLTCFIVLSTEVPRSSPGHSLLAKRAVCGYCESERSDERQSKDKSVPALQFPHQRQRGDDSEKDNRAAVHGLLLR